MAPKYQFGRGGKYFGNHLNGHKGMSTMANYEPPASVKCINCGLKKPNNQFSNKQLGDLRERMNQGKEPTVRCKACNSGQVFEMHCSICDQTKAKTEFSKAQRSNPDGARCLECVRQIAETEPGKAVAKSRRVHMDSDDSDELDDIDSEPSHPFEDEAVGGMSNMSLSGREMSVRSGATSSAAPRGYVSQPRQTYSVASDQSNTWGGSDFYGTGSTTSTATRAQRWAKAPKPLEEDEYEGKRDYYDDGFVGDDHQGSDYDSDSDNEI